MNIERALIKKYDVEYNQILKILYIHNPVAVRDFIYIKNLFKDREILDIRVEPRCGIRW